MEGLRGKGVRTWLCVVVLSERSSIHDTLLKSASSHPWHTLLSPNSFFLVNFKQVYIFSILVHSVDSHFFLQQVSLFVGDRRPGPGAAGALHQVMCSAPGAKLIPKRGTSSPPLLFDLKEWVSWVRVRVPYCLDRSTLFSDHLVRPSVVGGLTRTLPLFPVSRDKDRSGRFRPGSVRRVNRYTSLSRVRR